MLGIQNQAQMDVNIWKKKVKSWQHLYQAFAKFACFPAPISIFEFPTFLKNYCALQKTQ